jgi:hypothetical protein
MTDEQDAGQVMPAALAAILEREPTDERWLAAWAQTLHMPEGSERERVLDVIADWACGLAEDAAPGAGEAVE